MASIIVKLVMSTALASWFLAAGQALYSVATITGTPNIFGMDSAIKFIYLTVPFAEALLRGDTELTGWLRAWGRWCQAPDQVIKFWPSEDISYRDGE